MSSSLGNRQSAVNYSSRTEAGDLFSGLVVQVFRLNGTLLAAGDALAAPARLTSARWQVLAAAESAPSTVAQMARALGLARQSVQRVANLLVDEGHATFEPNDKDRRADLFCLNDSGRDALATIQVRQRAWANGVGAAIGTDELRRALESLAAVSRALSGE